MKIDKNETKIAIIVGAGAVENAWIPVYKAISKITGLSVDSDGANCFFARAIYMLRFYSKLANSNESRNFELELKEYKELKKVISQELLKAQERGEIKPRKEFSTIISKFTLSKTFGFISTNWDMVIDNEIDELVRNNYNVETKTSKCFHIHGSIDSSDQLYLPSETIDENYRSKDENYKFGVNHKIAMDFLKDANEILLYGLSLDPLDAELSQLLSSIFFINKDLKDLIIVNPEFEKVQKRIKLLLPRDNINIQCFTPSEID